MKIKTNIKGSVALMSVLIVSAVLIIFVLSVSETQISTSYQYVNTSSGKYTYYIAESCMEEAMIKLKTDTSYNGETLNLEDNSSCEISITGDSPKTITIITNSGNYTKNFEGEITITTNGEANNITLLNWHEI